MPSVCCHWLSDSSDCMTPVWLCVCLCRACQQRRSVTLTSYKVERRDMTVNSEVSFPALCFQNHVCDTTGKTHCKILTEFLCIFFSFRNGLFPFRAEWCRSVSVCVRAAWTPGPIKPCLFGSESLLTGCDSLRVTLKGLCSTGCSGRQVFDSQCHMALTIR